MTCILEKDKGDTGNTEIRMYGVILAREWMLRVVNGAYLRFFTYT